ncbi:MAG TPA: methyltransferase domain-containing protein [Candidatus Accumulibacter phosphatis]|nr:MAG: Thiopurine S-methyltransferase [Candidatus Accumulibacter sp. SK-11]HAY26102.1 methyltransferase domain-containing protein [Accumulibacter sp.]HCN67742.1 methyltransferase domain-containing protein [Accumulibacter sp.]HRL75569.1 methyltransferase domain-containing protein [Candidatus Accumulibacter phosphatis]HRQ93798.1 methyltransferase domain-containing protein [Candidatus Accumulibacter phosphatis]
MSEKPACQRPELADFWDHRFRGGVTPWDAGAAPLELRQFARDYVATSSDAAAAAVPARHPPRVLIPGCGSGFDAAYLDRHGWQVTALDFSAAAIELARRVVGQSWRGTLLAADFFSFTPVAPFDVVYERAFLCALPRHLWSEYAHRMADLLPAGGQLVGYFFFAGELRGPPFGILPEQLEALLTPGFVRREDRAVSDSLPVFAGRERWQVWQRL